MVSKVGVQEVFTGDKGWVEFLKSIFFHQMLHGFYCSDFKNHVIIFICMGMCLHVILCTTCVPGSLRDQQNMPDPLELELVATGLWAAMQVLFLLEPGALEEQPVSLMAEPSLQSPPILCIGFQVAQVALKLTISSLHLNKISPSHVCVCACVRACMHLYISVAFSFLFIWVSRLLCNVAPVNSGAVSRDVLVSLWYTSFSCLGCVSSVG